MPFAKATAKMASVPNAPTADGNARQRTFLSFSLEVEIEGRWPWDRKKGEQRQV